MRMFSSDWQRVAFAEGLLTVVMAIGFFGAPMLVLMDLLVWKTGCDFVIALVLLFVAITASFVLKWLYRKGHDMKEEPVEQRGHVLGEEKWDEIWSDDKKLTFERSVALYEWEFLLNAFMHPRSVFSRINEYISPGRRMLDCDTHYEVKAPQRYGLIIRGAQDYEPKNGPASRGESAPCKLLIPVAFQERGGLTISQQVYGSSGVNLPIVKQGDFTDMFVRMINSYMDYEKAPRLQERTEELLREYLRNIRRNPDVRVPETVCGEMLDALGDSWQSRTFCRDVLRVLVGLKDVIPVCVSLHVAAGQEEQNQEVARLHLPRIFKLSVREKREMLEKPVNVIPNRDGSHLAGVINWVLRKGAHQGDTIYYNMANAGRSTSYHLHVEGPENTYYARGSLIRENAGDRRQIYAEQVEMQKRCGQRNAHIYIRSGHRMVNTAFMFRFRKAPLDSYHIMFVATLLCMVVLSVCLMGSTEALGVAVPGCEGGSSGLSAVSMLLAVVSAAGSWIYGRAWDGREESFGITMAVVATVGCSVVGMLLSGLVGADLIASDSVAPELRILMLTAWGAVISTMLCVTALIGYAALRHGSIYRYLLAKDPSKRIGEDDWPASDGNPEDWIVDDTSIIDETVDGMRCDTPQGRYVSNDYRLWVKSQHQFERRYGVDKIRY